MFHTCAVGRERKSLFFKAACPSGAKKRSDNLESRFFSVVHKFALTVRNCVVILDAMYPRTVKVRSTNGTVNEYVRVVEAFREDGKVKQRVVADLGRKDLLVQMLPKLQRLLAGDEPFDTAN